jgi:hypothetical protein
MHSALLRTRQNNRYAELCIMVTSIRNYMPGKEVFKEHPEWFALKHDGKPR